MKKINKLQIKSEKIIKEMELVLIRGGYEGAERCGQSCVGDLQCGGLCPKCSETAGGWPRPACTQV